MSHAAREQAQQDYTKKSVPARRALIRSITAKPKAERTTAEHAMLAVHKQRAASDRRAIHDIGFVPRERYGSSDMPTPGFRRGDELPKMPKPPKPALPKFESLEDAKAAYKRGTPAEKAAIFGNPKQDAKDPDVIRKYDQAVAKGATRDGGELPFVAAGKALELAARPAHASAAAALQSLKNVKEGRAPGTNVGHVVGEAATGKDKTTYSDVLAEAGVHNKAARVIGGFALDVGLDPTTYLTFGAGPVARHSADVAARKAFDKAIKSGMSDAGARTVAHRAAKQALAKHAPKGQGLTIKVAGHEVPGVRRATAAANRGRRAASRRVRGHNDPTRAGSFVRSVTGELSHNVRPEGLTRDAYESVRQAARTTRAEISRSSEKAALQAQALRKRIGEDSYSRVIDAIESDNLRSLPAELRREAKGLQDTFKYLRRQEHRAGIPTRQAAGTGRRVAVPKVTADTKTSAAELAKARRARVTAERAHEATRRAEGVAQGRAEVLSRNVGSRAAEKLAERGRRYAGGGYGVQQASEALKRSGEAVTDARAAVARAEARHEATKAAAKEQRIARMRASKANDRADEAAGTKGYVPHVTTQFDDLVQAGKPVRGGVGRKKIRPGFNRERTSKAPLSELRETNPGQYSEDLPRLLVKRASESGEAVARSNYNRRIADLGTDVTRKVGKLSDSDIPAGHSLYHVAPGADAAKPLARVPADAAKRPGRYVILDNRLVDEAYKALSLHNPGAIGKAFDRVMGKWKFLATAPNPGFHIRNLVGDTANAYLAENVPSLARNVGQSARAIKRLNKQERALRTGTIGAPARGLKAAHITIKNELGRPAKLSYDDLIREAEKSGAIRSGFLMHEVRQMAAGGEQKIGNRATEGLSRASRSREDLLRLATYIGGRKRGLNPEAASARAAKFHFDYADLTPFEKTVARRVMPFWTFSARNIPLQFKSLLQRPGKLAQYEKVRQSFAEAFGLDDDWQNNLSEYEARSLPVPIKYKGATFTVSFGASGLPITDLNELPLTKSPGQALDEWFQRATSMLTPAVKSPIEWFANYSFFFRDQLERDDSPLVPAPPIVGSLPAPLRKKLGIVPDLVNKRTGKKSWGWSAKADYLAQQMPGWSAFAVRAMKPQTSSTSASTTQEALGQVAGLRIRQSDPVTVKINRLYDQRDKLEKTRAAMSQRQRNGTPAYKQLNKAITDTTAKINALKSRRGDKIIAGVSKPKGDWDFTGSNATAADESDWDFKSSSAPKTKKANDDWNFK